MSQKTETYKVWACDNMVYGPIGLDTLLEWGREERVLPTTWILVESQNAWHPAREIPELRAFFDGHPAVAPLAVPVEGQSESAHPDELRSFCVFSGLSNRQLEQFIRFCSVRTCGDEEVLIKRGDPGDAVFFVLSGSVRARLVIGMEDKTLAHIPSGEFFGEMAMFSQSPRSADIVAEGGARLLRLSAEAFVLLTRELPDLACPILFGMARVMSARISDDNQRLRRDAAASFVWR